MTSTDKTALAKRAAAAKAKYHSTNEPLVKAYTRMVKRLLDGSVPQQRTMDKLGLTHAKINDLLKEHGKPTIDFGKRPVNPTNPSTHQVDASDIQKAFKKTNMSKTTKATTTEPHTTGSASTYTLVDAYMDIDAYENWKDITKKQYKQRMSALVELLGCDRNDDIVHCLKSTPFGEIHDKIVAKYKLNANDIFSTVNSLGTKASPRFKLLLGSALLKKFFTAKNDHSEKRSAHDITKVMFDDYEPWDNIQAASKEVHAAKRTDQNALVISLYSDNPVVRDDYGFVKLIKNDDPIPTDKSNFYVVKTNLLVLNEYKTSRRGPHEFKLNTKTKRIVTHMLKKDPTRSHLLVNTQGNALGKLSQNAHVNASFRTTSVDFDTTSNLTINTLRHSVISHSLNGSKRLTGPERKKLAKSMMSNIIVQAVVYDRRKTT